MKRLLIQSDDFGMTHAITDGTIRSIQDGIIRNTGLFVNMDSSTYAANRIKDIDVCLGIDINLLSGYPVSPTKEVPSLVTESGHFRSSQQLIRDYKLLKTEKYLYFFENDPFDYNETLIETENQVKRFIKLVGKTPEYINSHSIITPNSEKAAEVIAKKYGIPRKSSDLYFNNSYQDLAYQGDYVAMTVDEQIQLDPSDDFLNKYLPLVSDNKTSFYIFHCGYIDKDLFAESSLTIQRMNDTSCVLNENIKQYITENEIKLITYRDL